VEESAGRIQPPKRWGEARFANIGMGYGFTATSLQLLQAAAVVASGGVQVQPQLLQAVRSPTFSSANAREISYGKALGPASPLWGWQRPSGYPQPLKRVLKETTARQVAQMMFAVAQKGSGKKAQIEGAWVAGKTGTAEKVNPQTGRYDKKRNRSSFVGMASASGCFANPTCSQIVAIVTVDEPQGAAYGGVVAAPVWRDITQAALVHILQQGD
ncbi:MAG: penicillin-binding transpeptidase domain-containing protein, partial [Myxococcota bacterium]